MNMIILAPTRTPHPRHSHARPSSIQGPGLYKCYVSQCNSVCVLISPPVHALGNVFVEILTLMNFEL